MGFASYLKQLLYPLRLYDLDHGAGAGELEALGGEMDDVYDWLSEMEQEFIPSTARDWGLTMYEDILPYHPAASTAKKRRKAVMALLRIDDASFTLEAIQDTISGCGISAHVEEGDTAQTVVVSFPGTRGAPDRYEAIKTRIELILPCHLNVVYALVYLTWQEVEGYGWIWGDMETMALTWDGLERYSDEED